ncbi:FAD-binding protein [Breoghania sp.]|uniref:FAD-binding protein n=1 Tax=Breoghania sp. TaxID=2065378 RepID=UPI00260C83C5|nr:FAD-binding protein [Breoghania sp.]MDJ0930158.1 FAD-binding protein [Breoghania sp.]
MNDTSSVSDRRFRPADADGVREVVAWATAEGEPLEVLGTGSKRALGRPVKAAHILDLSALTGVEDYEPAELVLTAKAATPIAEVEALLAENGQEFAFEPMDYGSLLGGESGRGMLGVNLAGPKRLKHGAARDHVLGIHAVSGRGEAFKSGGTVVKNVTGYDLSRGLAGSWGSLAVTTLLSLKVLPALETEATVMIEGLADAPAVDALCLAMGTSAEACAAAHLPAGLGASLGLEVAATLIRLEGFSPSVDYRFEALAALMKRLGSVSHIEADASRALWRGIRDVRPFCGDALPVWRISVTPMAGAEVVVAIRQTCSADAFYDCSGGLVWLRMSDGEPHEADVRGAIGKVGGGHATLVRAEPSVRSSVPVFQPQDPALAALSRRLKAQFDPAGILNPGRMRPEVKWCVSSRGNGAGKEALAMKRDGLFTRAADPQQQ